MGATRPHLIFRRRATLRELVHHFDPIRAGPSPFPLNQNHIIKCRPLPPAKKKARASKTANGCSIAQNVTVHMRSKEDYGDEDEDEDGGGHGDDDTLGDAYEREYGTREFSATIAVAGKRAGSLSGRLLDRPSRSFHAACDADSAELQEVGCVLFGSDGRGKPRHAHMTHHARVALSPPSPEFRVEGATDVGAAAIDALLRHPDLVQRWTVAAYIADSDQWMTEEKEVAHEHDRTTSMARMMSAMSGVASSEQAESAADRSRHQGHCARMAKDARQFVRSGFKEIDYAGYA